MRITLVISSLRGGGAERVISNLAKYWGEHGWSVTLITLASDGADVYSLDERVLRIALCLDGRSSGVLHAIFTNIRRIFALRTAISSSRPDAVISFMDSVNVLSILATRFTGFPIFVAERVDPRVHDIGKAWERLRRLLYPMANGLIIQTRNIFDWGSQCVGARKTYVIPNPVHCDLSSENRNDTPRFPEPYILAMGRLERQKGFDLLLEGFSRLIRQFPGWSLVVLGEGSERCVLEEKIARLGLASHVYLPGYYPKPMKILKHASIFVLSSRYEGFPNVLLEAMACGVPSISFDCPSGPSEIIRNGIDGILVPAEDVGALALAMQDLMAHPKKRERLILLTQEVRERFAVDKVMGLWEDMLKTGIASKT